MGASEQPRQRDGKFGHGRRLQVIDGGRRSDLRGQAALAVAPNRAGIPLGPDVEPIGAPDTAMETLWETESALGSLLASLDAQADAWATADWRDAGDVLDRIQAQVAAARDKVALRSGPRLA